MLLFLVVHSLSSIDNPIGRPSPRLLELDPASCHIEIWQGSPSYVLGFSLLAYTNGGTFYNQPIRLNGSVIPYQLLYLPCGSIPCPQGYDCGGDESAMVWVCGSRVCTAYGLENHGITFNPYGEYIFAGLDVWYRGDFSRIARAFYTCDEALPPEVLKLPDTVELVEGSLYFEVQASRACPTGTGTTPTPHPRFLPEKPSKGPTATPEPLKSPNPQHILRNGTHFVVIDLQDMQETYPMRGRPYAVVPRADSEWGYWLEIYTEWSSWQDLACPAGWRCPNAQMANLWQCWVDLDFQPFCAAVAHKFVPGTTLAPNRSSTLDAVTIVYNGDFGASMRIVSACNESASPDRIPITSDATIWYRDPQFTIESQSAYVCPKEFGRDIPTAPRPAVSDGDVPMDSEISATIDGQQVALDLTTLGYLQGEVLVGYDSSFHSFEIHYSPWALLGCPRGKNCGRYQSDQANVWGCIGSSFPSCYPLGDKRYGLNLSYIGEDDPLSGIKAMYLGGAAGSDAQFEFQCNESIPIPEVHFNQVARQTVNQGIVVYAQTNKVCIHRPEENESGRSSVVGIAVGCGVAGFAVVVALAYFLISRRSSLLGHGSKQGYDIASASE
jgi:hypothetical protein